MRFGRDTLESSIICPMDGCRSLNLAERQLLVDITRKTELGINMYMVYCRKARFLPLVTT